MGASAAIPRAESEHGRRVRGFFAEPDRYLGNDARLGIRRQVCRELAGKTDRSTILDVGCGDGTMSLPLLGPEGRLTLLDFSPPMLERAAANVAPDERNRVELVCGDLGGFAPGRRFTLVLCLGVLAHVPDVPAAIAKVSDLVAPGGHCLVQITDAARWLGRLSHAWYTRRHGRRADGYALNRLDGRRLVAEAAARGLRLVAERHYSLTVPGLRRLPVKVQFAIERGFYASPLASRGGESIFLFARNGG
jgi:SAM-dependent methyltransferase